MINKYQILLISSMIVMIASLLVSALDYNKMIDDNEKYCDGEWTSDNEKYYCHTSINNREITQTWNKNIIWEMFR